MKLLKYKKITLKLTYFLGENWAKKCIEAIKSPLE